MRQFSRHRLLRISAWVSLASIALMVWSFLDPRPLPMVAFMTVGQVLGTVAFGVFLVVVVVDVLRPRSMLTSEWPRPRKSEPPP